MKFNIPYIPDNAYVDFLVQNADHLDAVHYSLHSGQALDSRIRFQHVGTQQLCQGLAQLTQPSKYCLLNTRFVRPDLYSNAQFISELMSSLEIMKSNHCLDGIVFCDYYFLNTLSRAGGSFFNDVQAVPGVNAMLDSPDKLMAGMDIISATHFALPEKICLDRSLNRNIPALELTARCIKNRIPGIRLELLANEGCLFQCPFKPAHDAHIALSNTGLVREMTFETNRDAGCIALLSRYPEKLFKSPFIRPEDVHHYEGVADVLKLCGRTLGPGFLKTVITAYIQRRYPGNLSDILDAAQWMSHVFHIDNTLLGKDFFKTLTNCSKDCTVCTICSSLKDLTIDRKKPAFYRYEDGPWKF